MSNLNGLASLKNSKLIGLIQSLEIKPKEAPIESHGTDLSKKVITWGAEFGAEIIKLVQKENKGRGVKLVLNILGNFFDDLVNVAPIIAQFDQLKKEIEDLSHSEAIELDQWLRDEVARALVEKGLIFENNSTKLVLKIISLAIDVIALHDEL